jgi:hypothetical protein
MKVTERRNEDYQNNLQMYQLKVMKIPITIFIVVFTGLVLSCKKQYGSLSPRPIASVMVVNAIPTSNPLIPVFGTSGALQYFTGARAVNYQDGQVYSLVSGANSLYIVQQTDTSDVNSKSKLFNGNLQLEEGGIYSFFLAGDTSKLDTLLVKDDIPAYTDSSAGVRFVNLSSNSTAISINPAGQPSSQGGVNNLAYRSISNFNQFSANSSVPDQSYIFEIRNQANDSLLLTYTWYYTLHKSNTLVISGMEGSATPNPLTVFQINNY